MSREPFPVDHPIVVEVARLGVDGWRGTASQLHALLELLGVGDLPPDAQRLAGRLRASEVALGDLRVEVRRSKSKGQKVLTIAALPTVPMAAAEPAPAEDVPAAPDIGSVRREGSDRIAPWSVGRGTCPECRTLLTDPNLVRNRRMDFPSYPAAHTIWACRFESRLQRRLEEEADERSSMEPRSMFWRVIRSGPPW